MGEQVTLVYNPYLPALRVSLNDRPAPQYGSVASLMDKPFLLWAKPILPALGKALNDRFSLKLLSGPMEGMMLETIASEYPGCTEYRALRPELNISTRERLEMLDDLRAKCGEKPTRKHTYLDIHISASLAKKPEYFFALTGERELFAGEEYDCILPGAAGRFSCMDVQTTLRLFSAAQIQGGGNACALLIAAGQDEADAMLQKLPLRDELVVMFLLADGGAYRFMRQHQNVLIFSTPPAKMNQLLEQVIDFALVTPFFRAQAQKFTADVGGRYDVDQEEIALRIRQITGVEPFYIVDKIDELVVGGRRKLGIRRVPGKQMPAVSVRFDPPYLARFDGEYVYASEDAEKPERVTMEVFAADRPEPISSQRVYVRPDDSPLTMRLSCSKSALSTGESVRVDLVCEHVKKSTPKTTQWRSSDTRVISVNDQGIARALSTGRATITAAKGDTEASIAFTVSKQLDRIELSSRMLALRVAPAAKQASPLLIYADKEQYADAKIAWQSSDQSLIWFEPRALSAQERAALPAGKMALLEGYVCCTQPGKAQLEFYLPARRETVKSFCNVTADAAALPSAPVKASLWTFKNLCFALTLCAFLCAFWPPVGVCVAAAALVCVIIYTSKNKGEKKLNLILRCAVAAAMILNIILL